MGTKMSALDAVSTLAASDIMHAVSSGVNKKITKTNLIETLGVNDKSSFWTQVPTANYSLTPATSSSLTVTTTSPMKVGMPIKYTISGTTYYAIITSVSLNAAITIAGPPFSGDLTADSLYYGGPERVVQMDFFVSGTYEDASGAIIVADMKTVARWGLQKGYLVTFGGSHNTVDTGTQPNVNVQLNASAVSTENTNTGPTMSGSINTVQMNSAVAINTSNYDIEYGEEIEIYVTKAGNGDAEDLTVTCIFVLE